MLSQSIDAYAMLETSVVETDTEYESKPHRFTSESWHSKNDIHVSHPKKSRDPFYWHGLTLIPSWIFGILVTKLSIILEMWLMTYTGLKLFPSLIPTFILINRRYLSIFAIIVYNAVLIWPENDFTRSAHELNPEHVFGDYCYYCHISQGLISWSQL